MKQDKIIVDYSEDNNNYKAYREEKPFIVGYGCCHHSAINNLLEIEKKRSYKLDWRDSNNKIILGNITNFIGDYLISELGMFRFKIIILDESIFPRSVMFGFKYGLIIDYDKGTYIIECFNLNDCSTTAQRIINYYYRSEISKL